LEPAGKESRSAEAALKVNFPIRLKSIKNSFLVLLKPVPYKTYQEYQELCKRTDSNPWLLFTLNANIEAVACLYYNAVMQSGTLFY
jgi:hypothetical protein